MLFELVKEEVENRLSDKLGESVKINSASNLGGGCINYASKLETNVGAFFIKWNSNCSTDIFLREAESLSELKKVVQNKLVIPNVLAAKKVDSTPGFLVQEYLPPGNLNKNDDENLGIGLALIHRHKSNKFGFYHDNYCGETKQDNQWTTDWRFFFRDRRLRFLLQLIQKKRPLPAPDLNIYEKLMQKIVQLIPGGSTPSLIHGDLWSGNYLVTQKGPALIDPASYYANPEMEFSIITMFGGFSSRFFNAYHSINPKIPGWEERNKLYQLYHVLNHYYLFGGSYRHQAIQIAQLFI